MYPHAPHSISDSKSELQHCSPAKIWHLQNHGGSSKSTLLHWLAHFECDFSGCSTGNWNHLLELGRANGSRQTTDMRTPSVFQWHEAIRMILSVPITSMGELLRTQYSPSSSGVMFREWVRSSQGVRVYILGHSHYARKHVRAVMHALGRGYPTRVPAKVLNETMTHRRMHDPRVQIRMCVACCLVRSTAL